MGPQEGGQEATVARSPSSMSRKSFSGSRRWSQEEIIAHSPAQAWTMRRQSSGSTPMTPGRNSSGPGSLPSTPTAKLEAQSEGDVTFGSPASMSRSPSKSRRRWSDQEIIAHSPAQAWTLRRMSSGMIAGLPDDCITRADSGKGNLETDSNIQLPRVPEHRSSGLDAAGGLRFSGWRFEARTTEGDAVTCSEPVFAGDTHWHDLPRAIEPRRLSSRRLSDAPLGQLQPAEAWDSRGLPGSGHSVRLESRLPGEQAADASGTGMEGHQKAEDSNKRPVSGSDEPPTPKPLGRWVAPSDNSALMPVGIPSSLHAEAIAEELSRDSSEADDTSAEEEAGSPRRHAGAGAWRRGKGRQFVISPREDSGEVEPAEADDGTPRTWTTNRFRIRMT
eukprot:1046807-Rhodomonas_salina.3